MEKCDFLAELEKISQIRKEDTTSLIANAVELGMSKLWQETIVHQYLKKEITREKAVDLLGIDLIKLVDRQRDSAMEDVRWGMSE